MYNKLLLLSFILITSYGCTRDDICSEDTPTTPLMVITFNDIANPSERKAVANLTIETQELNPTAVISNATTDSIAIPLRTTADLTNYRFISNDNSNSRNVDYLEFTYSTEAIYVNRACAFKAVFHDLAMDVQNEGTATWVLSFEIQTTDIEDETETHITIFH